jgi:sugar lactone lactonase YvrE
MRARALAAVAILGACGISPAAMPPGPVLGVPPGYGPAFASDVPNAAAIDTRIWVPGLDQGWNPQGLAVAAGSLLVSAYRSDGIFASRGPCRVFRIDPSTGKETAQFDVPPPCGHAGGLAHGGDGWLYVADTHTLFAFRLDTAFGKAPVFRRFRLGPGLRGSLAGSDRTAIWLGTYNEDRPGRIFKYDLDRLGLLPDGALLTPGMSSAELEIPSYAQGAAVDRFGVLWVSRSDIAWGSLEQAGTSARRWPVPGGVEGIAFDASGRLWLVSEAGARHLLLRYPFFPMIFRLDLGRLAE